MRRKYDSNDAVMSHQAVCNRICLGSNPQLLEDYLSVCREHADTLVARNTHQRFLQQVEAMRALLSTQRQSTSSTLVKASSTVNNNGAPGQQLQSQNPTSYPRTQFVIIPQEWGREHYKKLVFSWNSRAKELSMLSTEAIVAWLLNNTAYEHYNDLLRVSDSTAYCSNLGLVFQKWTNIKDAKNYVQALHAVINAPLSRFVTPFAFCLDILGQAVLVQSVAPVETPWHTWRQAPLCAFHIDGLCASIRMFYHAFTRVVGTSTSNNVLQDDDDDDKEQEREEREANALRLAAAAATSAAQGATIEFVDYPGMELLIAIGTDARWYILDGRSIANRQPHGRRTQLSMRMPRRECMFTPGGVLSTPYTPNEFILRFKIKIIAEHLLTDPLFAQGVSGLLSSIMHQHGVRFGPFVYPLYLYICEQERQFRSSVNAANRRNAMTAAAVAKLSRYQHVKQVMVAEMLSRVVKQLIREELNGVFASKPFQAAMLESVSDPLDKEEETERIVGSLNTQLMDVINLVLAAMFNATSAFPTSASRSIIGASSFGLGAPGSPTGVLGIAPQPSDGSPIRSTGGGGGGGGAGGGNVGHKFSSVALEGLFFEDMVFMMNDRFVNRIYALNELQTECRVLGVPYCARMELKVDDVDVPRVLVCLEQLLGVSLVVRGQKLIVDPLTNFIEGFFNLDSKEVNALRGETLMTTVELPLCLVSGARSKILDYSSLQQRIAAKLASMVDGTQTADVLHYSVSVVKFILLGANDVVIAHRGYVQDEDFEDVWNVHQQISCPPTVYGGRMMTAFEGTVALRIASLMAATDLQVSLRRLMKFTEATRSLYDSPVGTAFVLADKINIVCRVCERFVAPGLVSALETALADLTSLTIDPYVYRMEGQQQQQLLIQGGRQRKNTKHAEIKTLQSSHLQLLPLSLLVRHVMLPDTKRTQGESLAAAVRYCTKRRDLIVEVYGEKSLEAGIACNDIAAICSNNKFDFDRAEEEFERAVFILTEVQPGGASLQITKNNLAFLCFRKAERLRKQIHFDAAKKGPAARAAINEEVNSLLAKAKMLLLEVMDEEQKLPVLDFAAALNNLASIKLFESKFEEAKALFTRTLEITARIGGGGGGGGAITGGGSEAGGGDDGNAKNELPCRVHALRNLKVLARRQYLNAVMRVQAAVRRFVTRIRERKNFATLRAIKPIQRAGRAFITRLYLAKHYRFSAFHCWLRKPKLFTRKLDFSFQHMPLEARAIAWQAKMSKATKILQRCGRGSVTRVCVGKMVCFLKAHFERRRPLVLQEIFKRRIAVFSGQMLRWKLLYGCEHVDSLCSLCQDGVRSEVVVVRADVHGEEARAFRWMFFCAEKSAREATERTWWNTLKSSTGEFFLHKAQHEWATSRAQLLNSGIVTLEADVRQCITTLEHAASVRQLQFLEEHLKLFLVESSLRSKISVEAFTKYVRPDAVRCLQKAAKGFLVRKFCGRLSFFPERETDLRSRIEMEEITSLNRQTLLRHMKTLGVMEEEESLRRILARNALAVFEKHPGRIQHVVTIGYLELVERAQWERKESVSFEELVRREAELALDTRCDEAALWILAREAAARKAITDMFSTAWLSITHHVFQQETSDHVKTYTDFALAMAQRNEQQQRRQMQRQEHSDWLLRIEEPCALDAFVIGEARAFQLLKEREQAGRVASQVSMVTRERHEQQRLDIELREQNQRQNVILPLEAVARNYMMHDWQMLVAAVFLQRCTQYSHRLLAEWYACDFVDVVHPLLSIRLYHEYLQQQDVIRGWKARDKDAVLHMSAAQRDEATCRQAMEAEWVRWNMCVAAEAEKMHLCSVALSAERYAWVQQLHIVAHEEVARRALVTDLQMDHRHIISVGLVQTVHPVLVSAAATHDFQSLQRLEVEHRESVSRRRLVEDPRDVFMETVVTVQRDELDERLLVFREEATAAIEVYFLERFSMMVTNVLMARLTQLFEKKYSDLRGLLLRREMRIALRLLQPVGRGYLRRRRFGRFHHREVVVPTCLIQRVCRGFLTRSLEHQLLFNQKYRRLSDEEGHARAVIVTEEDGHRATLAKFETSFAGTLFLRLSKGGSTSSAVQILDLVPPVANSHDNGTAEPRAIGGARQGSSPSTPYSDLLPQSFPQSPTEPAHPKHSVHTAPRPTPPHRPTQPVLPQSAGGSRGGPRVASAPAARRKPSPPSRETSTDNNVAPAASTNASSSSWRQSRFFATPAWQSSALHSLRHTSGSLSMLKSSGAPSSAKSQPHPDLEDSQGGGEERRPSASGRTTSQDASTVMEPVQWRLSSSSPLDRASATPNNASIGNNAVLSSPPPFVRRISLPTDANGAGGEQQLLQPSPPPHPPAPRPITRDTSPSNLEREIENNVAAVASNDRPDDDPNMRGQSVKQDAMGKMKKKSKKKIAAGGGTNQIPPLSSSSKTTPVAVSANSASAAMSLYGTGGPARPVAPTNSSSLSRKTRRSRSK